MRAIMVTPRMLMNLYSGLTEEKAMEVLMAMDKYARPLVLEEVAMITDYILNGEKSIHAEYFKKYAKDVISHE